VKAGKLVAAKVVLSARVDAMQGAPDGSVGQRFVEDIQGALDKAQEPPPNRSIKPLKRPDDKPSRKRGGRRYRALKERLGLTAVRKAANRMSTSESAAEYGDVAMGQDRGLLNQDEGGGIRVAAKQQTLTKRRRTDSGGGGGSGLASSIAFTPVQGMEMVNPEAAAERVRVANAKYFGSSGFANVKKSEE
jgi:U4/U6 small nuclear ribonucleoprotein PRP31